jgi:hypothetical protein
MPTTPRRPQATPALRCKASAVSVPRSCRARYLRDRSPAANAARSLPALVAIDGGERHVDAARLYTTRPAISWILARSRTRHSMPNSAGVLIPCVFTTIRLAARPLLAMVPLLQLLAKMLHGEARIALPACAGSSRPPALAGQAPWAEGPCSAACRSKPSGPSPRNR